MSRRDAIPAEIRVEGNRLIYETDRSRCADLHSLLEDVYAQTKDNFVYNVFICPDDAPTCPDGLDDPPLPIPQPRPLLCACYRLSSEMPPPENPTV